LVRLGKLARLCVSITSFHPILTNAEKSRLKERLIQSLSSSDVVHVLRLPEMVSAIHHKQIVWDVELPWLALPTSTDQQRELSERYSKLFGKCRKVFACSALVKLQAQLGEIVVVPNVAIEPEIGSFDASEKPPTLVCVGNLNYAANIEGLGYFVKSILPDLAENVPEIFASGDRLSCTVRGPRSKSCGTLAASNSSSMSRPVRHTMVRPSQRSSPFSPGRRTHQNHRVLRPSLSRIPTTKGCEGLGVARIREHLLIEDSPTFASACA
jgi:hypothetical protein